MVRADQAQFDVRGEISEIFADGFSPWLGYFSKDKNKIAAAFAHMFILNQFYVAVSEGKVVGIAACTNGISHSVKLDRTELRKHLGIYKGSLAGVFLKKEFEAAYINFPPGAGSIEFIGTSAEYRGKGIASQLVQYILEHTPYQIYLIEEVADTNIPAMKLYQKLGFEVYKSKPIPVKRAEKIGINQIVSLKYTKNN